ADRLAYCQQNLGETLLKLNKPEEAVVELSAALDYWVRQDQPQKVTDFAMQQEMEALLRAKRFNDSVEFARKWIQKDKGNRLVIWQKIRDEITRLRDNHDRNGALEVVEQAKKIENLGDVYRQLLERFGRDIQLGIGAGGRGWVRHDNVEHAAAPAIPC